MTEIVRCPAKHPCNEKAQCALGKNHASEEHVAVLETTKPNSTEKVTIVVTWRTISPPDPRVLVIGEMDTDRGRALQALKLASLLVPNALLSIQSQPVVTVPFALSPDSRSPARPPYPVEQRRSHSGKRRRGKKK
jgi:hypothetical protein